MADAHGSGPCVGNNMRVQVPSSALDVGALKQRNVSELFSYIKLIRMSHLLSGVAGTEGLTYEVHYSYF